MAFPTALDDQMTDSVSQAGLEVIGDTHAIGGTYLFAAASYGMHGLVDNQQQTTLTMPTANGHRVSGLRSSDTRSSGQPPEENPGGGVPATGPRSTCHRRSR